MKRSLLLLFAGSCAFAPDEVSVSQYRSLQGADVGISTGVSWQLGARRSSQAQVEAIDRLPAAILNK